MGVCSTYCDALCATQTIKPFHDWEAELCCGFVGQQKNPVMLALTDGISQCLLQILGYYNLLWVHSLLMVGLISLQR
jgi:hypothetical protein